MNDAISKMDAARKGPHITCPASRHVSLIATALIQGEEYFMLHEEPHHCGESMAAVVTALWDERDENARLRAENKRLRDERDRNERLRSLLPNLVAEARFHSVWAGEWHDNNTVPCRLPIWLLRAAWREDEG